jgi:hypothetical protein
MQGVCVCVRARACVCVYVCMYVCMYYLGLLFFDNVTELKILIPQF